MSELRSSLKMDHIGECMWLAICPIVVCEHLGDNLMCHAPVALDMTVAVVVLDTWGCM